MDLLELGHVTKAHGLRGDLILHLTTNRTERVAPGAELFLGKALASVNSYIVAHGQDYQGKWLVTLEGVSSREAADALRGLMIFGEPLSADELIGEESLFVHELIGKRVVDQHGTDHGPVLSVIDNPASDLLDLGDDKLVPLAFFVAQDQAFIRVDIPLGLLDNEADEAR